MNTTALAPAFRCPFCGQATEPSSVLPVACTSCLTTLLGQAQPAPLDVPPLGDVTPSTTATAPTESMANLSADLPDGLLAELVDRTAASRSPGPWPCSCG